MYHTAVLLKESIESLNISPEGIYFDVTYGGGSHSREILGRLSSKGRLYAIDQDPDAHKNKIENENFHLIYGNFRYLRNYLDYYGIEKIDGIIADLGISSHQIDVLERGFSYRLGGNLDMRMNPLSSIPTAADILNSSDEKLIFYIFKNYCDIHNPTKLSEKILEYRSKNKFGNIQEFINLITPLAPKFKEIKYFSQVFQALRISVNDEINALTDFLNTIPEILKIGGRISIISYHSLEDRLVKNLIKDGNTNNNEEINLFGTKTQFFKSITKKAIIPQNEEIINNPRAKSAKLRVAELINNVKK